MANPSDNNYEMTPEMSALGHEEEKTGSSRLIDSWSEEIESELTAAFGSSQFVALGCEGVDISRLGRLSLVTLCSPESHTCYILDVLEMDETFPLVIWLDHLLVNPNVVKVMHDSRFQGDALKYHLKINVTNVHDTLCWNNVLTETEDLPLKEVLAFHDLSFNEIPLPRNTAAWIQRPLPENLLAIASGNVEPLLRLRDVQHQSASRSQELKSQEVTKVFLNFARSAKTEVVVAKHSKRFQGNRNSHLRMLQEKTNTLIAPVGKRTEHKFVVFYEKPADLEAVKEVASS